jgi:radical SAM superfamily enzyme YgiQ (UPF0313 family)
MNFVPQAPAGKILFIQLQQFAYPGLYYLAGALRASGHRYELIATNRSERMCEAIARFQPDLIGFPAMTGIYKEILQKASDIKERFPGSKIIIGGIHPTLYPDSIRDSSIDFICRGEGERPLVRLLEALVSGAKSFAIPNISYKRGDETVHNDMEPLADPVDSLPFPDYSIYRNVPVIASDTYPMVFMTRGCPFSCTYCHNSNRKKIYRGLGKYVRSFGVERVLDEVVAAISAYPDARAVFLGSDTVGDDMVWLEDLLTKYRIRFSLPYTCLVRPEFISEKLVLLLKATNCHMVAFGLESGSERVRRELLHRHYSNEHIIRAAALLKNHGIRFRTYNIIGFPSETPEEMLQTLDLNLRIRPDYPWCSIFTPYPETPLTEFSIAQGYLDKDFTYENIPVSFFNDTILQNVDRRFILNLHSFFQSAVLVPALSPLLRRLMKLPSNFLFRALFKAVYAYTSIRSERRSLFSFLKLAFANRWLFK